MNRTIRLALLAALFLAACGKGGGGTESSAKTNDKGGSGASSGDGKSAKPLAHAASRGPEHPVYSLVDNRLSAHLERGGGLVLAAGSAGFAKYTRFGNTEQIKQKTWELSAKEGDVRVGKMTGGSARVDVVVTAAMLTGNPVVRVRAYSADARAFSVRVNENADINGQLQAGWSVVEFPVPAGQLKEGENQLLFFVRGSGLSVDWIQVGGAAPGDAAATFYDPAAKALLVPDGGAMSWYAFVPDKARVTADLDDASCEIAVTATGEDGQQVTGSLVGVGSAVDLDKLSGKAVRLSLAAKGCAQARLTGAALVVPGAEPTPAPRGAPPKYVVLLIMDSLRADRVRAFNPEARAEAPTWDKLAEDSALFDQMYVQGNESRVSHASIWTSMYPIKHSFLGENELLDYSFVTIDEMAKSAGLFTAGASANGFVAPKRWHFGEKWDKFSNHIHESLGLKAQDILEKGWSFVGDKKEPWFLYMGFVDTHVSWRAHDPWIEKYDPGYSGRFADTFSGGDAGKARSGALTLTEKEKQHVIALYDSDVSYQDDVMRQLIEKLQAAGIWEQTMLIVTADHGDEQWEDGRVGHGGSNRDMLVHVPLLIHYPPMFPKGMYPQGVESVDIMPTVADALGVPMEPEWQGESLIPLVAGVNAGYPRMSFNTMYETSHAGRILQWKARIKGGNAPAIYDFSSDPDEKKDLWGEDDAVIGGRAVLDPLWLFRSFNKEWKKSQWGNAANVTSRFASDLGE
jgi:arylsulfatase A-like enzyme